MTNAMQTKAAANLVSVIRAYGSWLNVGKLAEQVCWAGSPEAFLAIVKAGERAGTLRLEGTRVYAA